MARKKGRKVELHITAANTIDARIETVLFLQFFSSYAICSYQTWLQNWIRKRMPEPIATHAIQAIKGADLCFARKNQIGSYPGIKTLLQSYREKPKKFISADRDLQIMKRQENIPQEEFVPTLFASFNQMLQDLDDMVQIFRIDPKNPNRRQKC